MRLLKCSTALAFALGFAGASQAEELQAWRYFVSDHAQPSITVVDAVSKQTLDTLTVNGPAALHRTSSGESVFAIQGAAGVVNVVSTGISVHDHGDHGDLKVEDASLLDVSFAGAKPSHFVEHGGAIALFFDGEGISRNVMEDAVLQGDATFVEYKTKAPHHGVSVAYGDHVLLSEPNEEKPDELPVGIRVVDRAGDMVGDVHACPDLHGEASSGNLLAFACATGLLLVTHGDNGPQVRHLPYAEALPAGKSTTLIGGRGLQYFLGNYGPDRIVLIDPAEAEAFRLIELPVRRVHFAVDPVRSKFAYIFTEDGQLHQLDVLSGTLVQSLKLTDPYSMDGHWSDPRPRIAVSGTEIAVTDPLKGLIHLVNAEIFEPAGSISLDGKPFNIVAVGGSGEKHDH
ncbi:zinc metallochaperone AztD [Aureimonas fodinaquatilis]